MKRFEEAPPGYSTSQDITADDNGNESRKNNGQNDGQEGQLSKSIPNVAPPNYNAFASNAGPSNDQDSERWAVDGSGQNGWIGGGGGQRQDEGRGRGNGNGRSRGKGRGMARGGKKNDGAPDGWNAGQSDSGSRKSGWSGATGTSSKQIPEMVDPFECAGGAFRGPSEQINFEERYKFFGQAKNIQYVPAYDEKRLLRASKLVATQGISFKEAAKTCDVTQKDLRNYYDHHQSEILGVPEFDPFNEDDDDPYI